MNYLIAVSIFGALVILGMLVLSVFYRGKNE